MSRRDREAEIERYGFNDRPPREDTQSYREIKKVGNATLYKKRGGKIVSLVKIRHEPYDVYESVREERENPDLTRVRCYQDRTYVPLHHSNKERKRICLRINWRNRPWSEK